VSGLTLQRWRLPRIAHGRICLISSWHSPKRRDRSQVTFSRRWSPALVPCDDFGQIWTPFWTEYSMASLQSSTWRECFLGSSRVGLFFDRQISDSSGTSTAVEDSWKCLKAARKWRSAVFQPTTSLHELCRAVRRRPSRTPQSNPKHTVSFIRQTPR
jgi:hypothetical protein